MTKAELISKIAGDCEVTKVQAGKAVATFIESVTKTVKKGQRFTIVGFGTFYASKRKARKGRNPQTGETIQIKAKKIVRFKAGKDLDNKVNNK
jgi:DNA-binding protein HU-beta